MLFQNAYRAESIGKLLWMICYFFTPDKKSHKGKLEDFMKDLLKWIEDFSKRCQLFKKEFKYMDNTIFITGKRYV